MNTVDCKRSGLHKLNTQKNSCLTNNYIVITIRDAPYHKMPIRRILKRKTKCVNQCQRSN